MMAINNYTTTKSKSFDVSQFKPSCWFKCLGAYIEFTSSRVEEWDALSA
jgi:hypothetical protein